MNKRRKNQFPLWMDLMRINTINKICMSPVFVLLLFFFLGLQLNVFLCFSLYAPHASYYVPLIIPAADQCVLFSFAVQKLLK